jgi:hypothetical protein
MFDVNKVNEEWCSLKTQSLLARSLTSLLMRSCLGIATLSVRLPRLCLSSLLLRARARSLAKS